ncbi:FAD-dependent oxidoreductase [Desulfuromonas carbonis]|uniref:FAD-dependent oxidoreductase n=1 Tax=Desulfuromonas sp. DDH964 TaxID=1823759 RepID=UPI00078B72CF|nr:FAD-dependent oxidoreductase [Desulfuromonas sp. DDH964]AMV72726.1 FAD-dependent pyridine nucleotide-disulfide oxidoreductase family protein [Desulfuromonas sp. DDH964]
MAGNRVVVIGGDAAGMSAAAKIRREEPRREILVLERTDHTSYSACGIPYWLGGLVENAESLVVRSPEVFRRDYDIEVKTGHEVRAIDPVAQRLLVRTAEGRECREAYDQLLIATGAHPFCPDLPGSDARGIFGLSTLASGERLATFIEKERPRRAVVIGGGYIGLEMAEALVRRKLEVALVDRNPEVMNTLDPEMGALVSAALQEVGVALYRGEELLEFQVSASRVTGVVTNARQLPADIVILGMGVRPNAGLAAAAGLELGVNGAINVDGRMQTGDPNIWAAGDCVASVHRLTGKPIYIALGTVANKQGLVAGINLAGGQAWFPGVMGTAVSKICQVEVARTGLQERELQELSIDFISARIEARTRAHYYPGAGPITVKLLAEAGSGRLLGAQIVGHEGAAKRIDIVATALTAGMTAADLVDLDLSYAPPYSPVWDPVQTAARQLAG